MYNVADILTITYHCVHLCVCLCLSDFIVHFIFYCILCWFLLI